MSQPAQTDSGLVVHSTEPLNVEPKLDVLRASFLTPQNHFYIRTHGKVPRIDPSDHRLALRGRVERPFELSLDELRRRFPRRSVIAALQCAGNRRADFLSVGHVSGEPWQAGAIGNAEWMGISLADVLHEAGVADPRARHVAFGCRDEVELQGERFRYAVSIPMAKARSPEVLLAFQMNGEPLSPEHGAPLRVIVPGFAGARSAKWVSEIEVCETPAETPVQEKDYKLLPPHMTETSVDWDAGFTIYEMPLNAAICEPARHARLQAGPVTIRGYAVAAGREIMRVDVSYDGGRHWQHAALEKRGDSPWSWAFWEAMLDIPAGEHELVARAWDSAGQTQPALPDLNASWHRVPVRVV
jgi:sulfite oxidase